MLNICFLIDDWDGIKPESNTTLRLVHEAVVRNHRVAILYPSHLTIRANVVNGFMNVIEPMEKVPESFPAFHKKVKFRKLMLPLNGFDCIFVRKDPPIDNIMLNFLDPVKDDTLIINDIDGMRRANNKTYTSAFVDTGNHILPDTHVSKNIDYLKRVIEESDKEKMILKPLNGFGGSGVIVLEKSAAKNIDSLLDFYIGAGQDKNYVIVQEYIENADAGDVRVLLLNGEVIGAYKRVPPEGDNRANMHAGGTAVKHNLTAKELEICEIIGPKLIADGLDFVGIDIINEKLIEVNVLSPGGIVNINKLNKVKLQRKVLDYVEKTIASKHRQLTAAQIAINKKIANRMEVKGG